MYRDPRSDMPVTQFDMKWVEKAGLVKFDFLGLKTLSVLQRAKELLSAEGCRPRPRDVCRSTTPRPMRLIARGDTVGVFQFESEGMRRALTQVRPDCFADIIALGALYRPGPMENIPELRPAQERAGGDPDYLHPTLEGGAQGNLRRHHLPGTGDADRPDPCRLQPWRGRPAASGDGQEDQGRDGRAEGALRRSVPRPTRASTSAGRRRSSSWSASSPATASTRATPPPTRWSAITRRG